MHANKSKHKYNNKKKRRNTNNKMIGPQTYINTTICHMKSTGDGHELTFAICKMCFIVLSFFFSIFFYLAIVYRNESRVKNK